MTFSAILNKSDATATRLTIHRSKILSLKIISASIALISLGAVASQWGTVNTYSTQLRGLTSTDDMFVTQNEDVNVAWIMTYPGSGADFMTRLVDAAVNQRTRHAYYYYAQTYCANVLDRSDIPLESFSPTPEDFFQRCVDNAQFNMDQEIIKRTVQLIRDPMDNVVVRYHQQHFNQDTSQEKDTVGFQLWCADTDGRFVIGEEDKRFYSPRAEDLSKSIPCHAEFFQYVQWHNNAIAMKNFVSTEHYMIHYGSFRDNFEQTAAAFWDFLRLPSAMPSKDESMPKFQFSNYRDYYNAEQVLMIRDFVKEFATEETWRELERYFPNENGESNRDITKV